MPVSANRELPTANSFRKAKLRVRVTFEMNLDAFRKEALAAMTTTTT